MNILFIVPPPYLPNSLHRIRAFNIIKTLSKKNNVHVLAVTSRPISKTELQNLQGISTSVQIVRMSFIDGLLNCFFHPLLPYEVAFCTQDGVEKLVQKIIVQKKIDCIYLKRIRSFIYIKDLTLDIPVLLDTTDAMSLFYYRLSEKSKLLKKIWYRFEAYKYKRLEIKIGRKIKNWIVSSEIDRSYLTKLFKYPISVIPNIVTLSDRSVISPLAAETNILLFQGLMDKPVNIDAIEYFINDIYPHILKKRKKTKLYILGPNPTERIRHLENKNIRILGYVAKTDKIYRKAEIMICPIRIGTGTRNKILRAWAFKKPVISTSIGASGLLAKDKHNILLANTAEEFTQGTLQLLTNKSLRESIGKNGYETVKKYYSPKVLERDLSNLLNHVQKKV